MIYGEGVTQQRFVSASAPRPAFVRGAATLAIYRFAAGFAAECGILIADTKLEFGLDANGKRYKSASSPSTVLMSE